MVNCCCCPTDCDNNEDNNNPLSLLPRSGIGPQQYPFLAFPLSYETELRSQRLRNSSSRTLSRPPDLPANWPYPAPRAHNCPYTPSYNPTSIWGHDPIQDAMDNHKDTYGGGVTHGLASMATLTGTIPTFYDWDGVTTFPIWFPTSYTPTQASDHRKAWYDWIYPKVNGRNYGIRGIKQLYEHYQPFVDEQFPTIAEYEFWSGVVLNHFRFLSGLDPVELNRDLFLQVTWASERKTTTYWDTLYPGTLDSANGPCVGGTSIHCGATFVPSYSDRTPYYTCVPQTDLTTMSQAEAILTSYNGTAIIQMSRNLNQYFRDAESGIKISGHSATFAFRSKVGFGLARSKWAGTYTTPPPGYTF
jgi:hypothetical protein